jgi:hypothetical protein
MESADEGKREKQVSVLAVVFFQQEKETKAMESYASLQSSGS